MPTPFLRYSQCNSSSWLTLVPELLKVVAVFEKASVFLLSFLAVGLVVVGFRDPEPFEVMWELFRLTVTV